MRAFLAGAIALTLTASAPSLLADETPATNAAAAAPAANTAPAANADTASTTSTTSADGASKHAAATTATTAPSPKPPVVAAATATARPAATVTPPAVTATAPATAAAPPAAAPPPAAAAPPAPAPIAPAAAPDAPAAGSATPLALHPGAAPTKPLTLAPTNEGMGIGMKLLLVVGLGAGLAFYLKKKKDQRAGAAVPGKIEILSRAAIGVRSQLVVVEVEGTRLLVGMTPSAIQTLAVLDTPEDPGTPSEARELASAPRMREIGDEILRPQNLGDRFRSLIGKDEPAPSRLGPVKSAGKARAARPAPRSTASAPSANRTPSGSREVAGQARGLLLSVDEDK